MGSLILTPPAEGPWQCPAWWVWRSEGRAPARAPRWDPAHVSPSRSDSLALCGVSSPVSPSTLNPWHSSPLGRAAFPAPSRSFGGVPLPRCCPERAARPSRGQGFAAPRPAPGAVLEQPRRCRGALRTPVPCGRAASAATWLRPGVWASSLHPGCQRCSAGAVPACPVPLMSLGRCCTAPRAAAAPVPVLGTRAGCVPSAPLPVPPPSARGRRRGAAGASLTY